MVTATPIGRAATGAVRKRSPGAGCTRPTSGSSTCGQRSSYASRSAVSAPGTGDGSARQTWTTSSTTRATGRFSATETTSRASVIAAIAARRREKCTIIAANQSAAALRRGSRLGRSGASRERRAGIPCRPLPGVRKFGRCPWKPLALPHERIFPHGEFRTVGQMRRINKTTSGVWSPAFEAGHSFHGSVPCALARRGPGTASENHALQNAAGGKEWTV